MQKIRFEDLIKASDWTFIIMFKKHPVENRLMINVAEQGNKKPTKKQKMFYFESAINFLIAAREAVSKDITSGSINLSKNGSMSASVGIESEIKFVREVIDSYMENVIVSTTKVGNAWNLVISQKDPSDRGSKEDLRLSYDRFVKEFWNRYKRTVLEKFDTEKMDVILSIH